MWRKHRCHEQWVKGKTMAIKKTLFRKIYTHVFGNRFPGVRVKWFGTKAFGS